MYNLKNESEKMISEELQMYAEKEYSSQLITVMLSKDTSSHVSIAVDSMCLFESNIAFAHYMFQNPRNALNILDDAFRKVACNISKTHTLKADMVYKENVHVRLIALPNLPEVYRSNLPNCSDVGQFLCISGTVIRTSTPKMLQYKKLWRCSKCKYEFVILAEVEQNYVCEKPMKCSNPEWCNGKKFTLMSSDINAEWCKDYQEIKLQEQIYNLNIGTVPRSMWVVLEDDLVESCHPGNDVIVSGVLIQRWKPLSKGSLIDIQLVILAHNIEVQNKISSATVSMDMAKEFGQFWQDHKLDPLKGRDFILSSICPQVFGLYVVKLAVALVLAGGVQKKDRNSRIRGDSHILLIGDPGTAKSQFLKFASKVCSRSVLTSGIGTTNAGLTVSAIKEGGRWQLEAGALVLADGGICCIDEFSCIKEQDKTCIHEAMEQQTISVAKAGLVCSLNTSCSILAATNPKGKYDENISISENTALGTPLLSRFDIILVLLDTYDEKWDEMVSSYILEGRKVLNVCNTAVWSVSKMKSYFTLVRQINPRVTPDCERVLRAYFTKQRSLQSRNASRTTPRLLQSLIRLAEGHARLMFRTEVLVSDAVVAITLMESSMLGYSVLEGLSPLHTIFPHNPLTEYRERARTVLNSLSMELSIEENYQRFYEECSIKKVLLDISAIWIAKDPYIFGRSQTDISAFQESNLDISDSTSNELQNCENSLNILEEENPIPKRARRSNSNDNLFSVHQIVVEAEIHQNNPEQFSTPMDLNIYDNISQAKSCQSGKFRDKSLDNECSQNLFKNTSNNVDNLSILRKVLDEPEFNRSDEIESIHSNNGRLKDQLSTLSDINNIFSSNIPQGTTSSKKCLMENTRDPLSENVSSVNQFVGTQSQRDNTSILEVLGISPEKGINENSQNDTNISPIRNIKVKPLNSQSASTNSFLLPKRSLADQLKSFAFSRTRTNSQQNFQNNFTIKSQNIDNTKAGGISELKTHCLDERTTRHSCITNSFQEMDRDQVLHSAENRNNKNNPDVLDKNVDQNFDSLNNLEASKYNQIYEIEAQAHTSEEPKPVLLTVRKPISNSLKKFMFSKRKPTQILNTDNSVNDDTSQNSDKN